MFNWQFGVQRNPKRRSIAINASCPVQKIIAHIAYGILPYQRAADMHHYVGFPINSPDRLRDETNLFGDCVGCPFAPKEQFEVIGA